MSIHVISQYLNPYPPYYTRPDPAKLSSMLLANIPSITLTKQTEFTICAIVLSAANLHPDMADAWVGFLPRIRAHWGKIKGEDDRPGMNDYHIVSWSMNGKKDHLEELVKARKRTDMRGSTAIWAISSIRAGSPDFDKAIEPLLAAHP